LSEDDQEPTMPSAGGYGEYVELTGDDLPYHLRLDAPPLAVCNRCERQTWDADLVGTEDRMTQPDGNPCGGRFESSQPQGDGR
jgi:hypothetical protein